ncbi:phage minor tail protein L [Pectobacterium carotovorum]|uniref:Phage minor tail protein L n=1 Tax=Pectobacterium carotovorum subsp. carotovorum TaxID=555 RepID=A0AAI9PDE7_PECCC|nr:phage minor tail protein L [Pectobacterium carotovorum]GKX46084.1 phage minor tail protein L [Pectobacterium carotovorum subsp. carotovorum]GLV68388.1 phage minor tail protein L [Pectobacterium carotovorum subsp. carotovorum]
MSLNTDSQKLEPGDRVRMFEVDCTAFDGPELYFHNHPIPHTAEEIEAADGDETKLLAKSIWWQGVEYKAWPTQIDGLEMTSDGSAPTPTLSVGNIDGTITALCLAYQNLAQATVRIHTTFAHYLDARNFPDGNDEADPTQERLEVWYIDSKIREDDEAIAFQLSSPADLQGIMIPTRQIHSLCTWCQRGQYRGASCGYTGTNYFDADGNPVDDLALDECSGLLSTGCKPRWGEDAELPFGGFPGSALIKR